MFKKADPWQLFPDGLDLSDTGVCTADYALKQLGEQ